MAAIKGDKMLSELSSIFDVHPNQITKWKARLEESAAAVFIGPEKQAPPVDIKALHEKIGQQTLEIDFLAGALDKAGLPSGKR